MDNWDVILSCDGKIQNYQDLARALTGNYQGAVEDFQVLVESIKDEDEKAKLEGWIETLKKGENPFNSEVLEELKNNRRIYG